MRRTSSPTVPAAALLAAALALSACAGARVPPVEVLSFLEVQADGASFRVVYGPADVKAARQVARALGRAAPRAQRFAPLSSPVTLTVHPDHDALERAVDRPGYSWLLAWARARTVELQSPRTWGRGLWRFSGATDAEVEELLVHELTHCAMFQAAGGEGTWVLLEVPRWFEEGMASVAAEQGYRRATLAELRRHWRAQEERHAGLGDGWAFRPLDREAEREGDPLLDPDPIYRERADLVYGAAHHAFAALVARHGDGAVREVITRLAAGEGFAQAFRAAVGERPDAFAEAFRAEVVAGGGSP
ncbi:MAG: hypothetical protein QM704_23225 [Anaeromyxobacteraceae bacterium]